MPSSITQLQKRDGNQESTRHVPVVRASRASEASPLSAPPDPILELQPAQSLRVSSMGATRLSVLAAHLAKLRLFLTQLIQEEGLVSHLTSRPLCARGAHARHTLLRNWPVRYLHVRVHAACARRRARSVSARVVGRAAEVETEPCLTTVAHQRLYTR
jgi:hypothetical protein